MAADAAVWPLLFSHRGPIVGRGYAADIDLVGRVLASVGSNDVWLDGVNPGAFGVQAKSVDEARVELRTTLHNTFVDFAGVAVDAVAFTAMVETFFNKVDEHSERAWNEAVARVRAGEADRSLSELPRFPADTKTYINVTTKPLADLDPGDNPWISGGAAHPELAAAA